MGKFFISNSKESDEIALNAFDRCGFRKKEKINTTKYFFTCYKKKKINHENLFIFDNNDFVAVNGTCIYKGEIGKSSLLNIYQDFNGDISSIRANAIGHYVILIKKGDYVYIFVDKYNLYNVFYYDINNRWIISNSLSVVVQTLKKKVIKKYRLFEEIIQIGTVGKETFYKGVYRLFGNEIIKINSYSGEFQIQTFKFKRKHWKLKNKTFSEVVDMYLPMVQSVFSSITKAFGENIVLEMTGGLDTRIVFAALNSVGSHCRIQYGVSNSPLVWPRNEDLKIVKEIAEKYYRILYLMNWRDNPKVKKDIYKKYLDRYGFHFKLYGCNDNYFKEYEGRICKYPKLLMNGYFGENLKGRTWVKTCIGNSISINNIIAYYHRPFLDISSLSFKNKTCWKNYKDYLKNEVLNLAINVYRIDTDGKTISKDSFNELRQIFSRCMDNKILNFQNEFTYSLSPFGCAQLYEFLFDVPYKYRKNDKFQFELIKRLDSSVIDVPIYSHAKKRIVKKENLMPEIFPFKLFLANYLYTIFEKFYPSAQISFNQIVRKIGIYKKISCLEINYQTQLNKVEPLKNYFNFNEVYSAHLLSRMILYTFAINYIGYEKLV